MSLTALNSVDCLKPLVSEPDLDFVGMGQERYRKVDTYSTGMKQKLKLAQAIVHDPKIVFLDEPTNGLDPKGQFQILDLIKSLWTEHGISTVVSSHLLPDIDAICDQVIIIARGKVLVHDTLETLKKTREGETEIVLEKGQKDFAKQCSLRGWKARIDPNNHIKIKFPKGPLNPLVDLLDEMGLAPLEIIPSPNALDDLFVQALETADHAD